MEKEKENGQKRVLAPFIPTVLKEKKKEIIPTNGRKPGGKIIPTQGNPTTMQYAKAYHTF